MVNIISNFQTTFKEDWNTLADFGQQIYQTQSISLTLSDTNIKVSYAAVRMICNLGMLLSGYQCLITLPVIHIGYNILSFAGHAAAFTCFRDCFVMLRNDEHPVQTAVDSTASSIASSAVKFITSPVATTKAAIKKVTSTAEKLTDITAKEAAKDKSARKTEDEISENIVVNLAVHARIELAIKDTWFTPVWEFAFTQANSLRCQLMRLAPRPR